MLQLELKGEKKILGMDSESFNIFIRRYGIGVIMLGMIIILAIASPTFRTGDNFISILLEVSINGLIAYGMVFTITTAGIDLSVGSMLAMGSVVIGQVLNSTNNIFLACVAAVLVNVMFGFMNGFIIAKFSMVPFVVTLATQLVIRGIAYLASGGYSQNLANPEFAVIGSGTLFNVIPYPVIFLIVVTIVAYILMHMTKFGRYVFAVGGNVNAARASGVNIFRTVMLCYVISGLFTGLASIIMTSRICAAQPNIGVGYETDAIAADVLGGTSFFGGVTTIPGVMMGIVIIGLIYNGMNLLGISAYWQQITKGTLIILAILLDMSLSKKHS